MLIFQDFRLCLPYFSKNVVLDHLDFLKERILFLLRPDQVAHQLDMSDPDFREIGVQELLLNDPVAELIVVLAKRDEDWLNELLFGLDQS